MKFIVHPSALRGSVDIPGSKSHTIRALVMGLLAEGRSTAISPLDSSDTRSCINMIKLFGAEVSEKPGTWTIEGKGGNLSAPDNIIDVGNSGTTLYTGMGISALLEGTSIFTGDHQIRSRPADGLLRSINDLGGTAFSTRENGRPPLVIRGRIKGGRTSIEAVTSQYLSSLLIAAPLANGDTEIIVTLLNEAPYVDMTLGWMRKLGIKYGNESLRYFKIKGGQSYANFSERIPADFSSATFFLVAAAVTGSEMVLNGLDFTDTQGDKEVVNILRSMGADIEIGEKSISVRGKKLKGGTFDLNAIPDSLPALAVAGCFADGETRLVNVPQARLKETDRISVMFNELKKMGADIEERPDGLTIRKSELKGAALNGHGDHRVVMALAVAGLGSDGTTEIETAESVAVTFPNFRDLMKSTGADINLKGE
jgi:3-phosphoshikimate 1-carboxyvinyltransferase